MALRDQPYFPFYVQDYMTDEKLAECSAEANGVYIRVMCLMHKSEPYGVIILKQKFKKTHDKTSDSKAKPKQNLSKISNFAKMLVRQMPYSEDEIFRGLCELIEEGVIHLHDDCLIQKRMKKDGEISMKRSNCGSKGGRSVKNSNTRKLYNETGFLYVISSIEEENIYKIGISKNPSQRVVVLSNKLAKKLDLVAVFPVKDMGLSQDKVLESLRDNRDGEWIFGIDKDALINNIHKLLKAKPKQNTEYENEYEYEIKNEIKNDNVKNIVDLYHSKCTSLPKVAKVTEQRKQKIIARDAEIKAAGNSWEAIFDRVSKSDFLCGRKTSYKANLDFIIRNEEIWVKISEGQYDNVSSGTSHSSEHNFNEGEHNRF